MLAGADFPYDKVWSEYLSLKLLDERRRDVDDVLSSLPAVNRLDRLTSGLMFFALNAKAANSIISDFIEGRVKKEYLARVRGEFPECVSLPPICAVRALA